MKTAFGGDISPRCEYCKFSVSEGSGTRVRCGIKREMSRLRTCRRFLYDPLKREPATSSAPIEERKPRNRRFGI